MTVALSAASLRTRDVWAHNLDEECALIREVVRKYPYIAMDTEFPGVVSQTIFIVQNKIDCIYLGRPTSRFVQASGRVSLSNTALQR